ncbi:MAG: STAS domain-containing protein [Ilumatobacteraceae bacterium]
MTQEFFMLSVVADGSARRVVAAGELDVASCPQLRAVLNGCADDATGTVTVDLSGVSFIDSTALAVLVQTQMDLVAAGRRLVIAAASPTVVRVLTLAGLLSVFEYEEPPP